MIQRILLLVNTIAIFAGCTSTGSSSKTFSPAPREHGQLVASQGNTSSTDVISDDSSWIKISILVPNGEDIDMSQQKRIENKILQLVSPFGIVGNGGSNPKHIIAPVLDLVSMEATSTAPTRYLAKYDVTFYVADVVSGTVFNSCHQQATGVGRSKDEAFINAMENIAPNQDFSSFIRESQKRIIKYFKDNGDAILAEANALELQQNYAGAIALLESIPNADDIHFSSARSKIDVLIPKYLKAASDDLLTKMKVALGSSPSDTINVVAMEYYQMIPTDSPCRATADQLYADYISKLSSEQAAKVERKLREMEADNAFRIREAELKAEVEGNAMLLEKYKKDAAYDRLPWLRKLIYLGDRDPFDGYEPKKNI